jgi:hypothetical protein
MSTCSAQKFVDLVIALGNLRDRGLLSREQHEATVLAQCENAEWFVKPPLVVVAIETDFPVRWNTPDMKILETREKTAVILANTGTGYDAWGCDLDIFNESYEYLDNVEVVDDVYNALIGTKNLSAAGDINKSFSYQGAKSPSTVWRYAVKKAAVLGYVVSAFDNAEVPSLEDTVGPTVATTGDMITMGVRGELWVVPRTRASQYVSLKEFFVTRDEIVDALEEAVSTLNGFAKYDVAVQTEIEQLRGIINRITYAGIIPKSRTVTLPSAVALGKVSIN